MGPRLPRETGYGTRYADVGDIYKELASNLSASLDFGNDDLLTWVWLNSLTDAEAAGLVRTPIEHPSIPIHDAFAVDR